MASDSVVSSVRVRNAVVYPVLIVVPLSVLTVIRPELGRLLLLVAALLGGIVFTILGKDSELKAYRKSGNPTQQREVSWVPSPRVAFGMGLFAFAGSGFVIAFVVW